MIWMISQSPVIMTFMGIGQDYLIVIFLKILWFDVLRRSAILVSGRVYYSVLHTKPLKRESPVWCWAYFYGPLSPPSKGEKANVPLVQKCNLVISILPGTPTSFRAFPTVNIFHSSEQDWQIIVINFWCFLPFIEAAFKWGRGWPGFVDRKGAKAKSKHSEMSTTHPLHFVFLCTATI